MIKRWIPAFATVALVLAACSGPLPITVTDYAPADGATGVAVDSVISATFSADIDVDTIDGAFTLSTGAGAVVGTLAYDEASRTATFTPAVDLAFSTTYTATVAGSVATASGVTLAGDVSWSFTTAPEPDGLGDLTVDPATAGILVGGTVQLDAVFSGITGTPDLSVTWTSDDDGVASVDGDGLVTGVAEGTATITATSDFDASLSATAVITVSPVPAVTSVDVAPATSEVVEGESVQLTATVTTVGGASDAVTWSSSDEAVATVDATGLVTTLAPGTVTITATSDFDDSVSGSAEVVALAIAIGGYTIDGPELPLAVGATAALTATPTGVVGSPDTSVTWSSGDEAVATVDETTGEVTAVAPGTATITATSVFDAGVTATFDVEVATPLEAVGIEDEGVIAGYIADFDAGTEVLPALPAPFTGGVAPYTFEVVTPLDAPFPLQGLPTGMTLDPATGELGGTPTVARFFNFAVEATDAIGQTAIAYGEIDVALVLTIAESSYLFDPLLAPQTVVPASDVTVIGADPLNILTFTLDLVTTEPAGGVLGNWSIDTATGAITYDVVDATERTWTFEVSVLDEVLGGTATVQVELVSTIP